MSNYDRIPWIDFVNEYWRWRQGEHVLVAAPTGIGKTHLTGTLVNVSHRRHVVMFVTKPMDDIFTKSMFRSWHRIERWPPRNGKDNRVLLWPRKRRGETIPQFIARQRIVFAEAYDGITDEGGWCKITDEQHWECDPKFLGLGTQNAAAHHFGRSGGITSWNNTQRPAWVPRITYSSVSHAFIGHTRDRDDLKRLSELGGVDPKELAENVLHADPLKHEIVYVPTRGQHQPVRLIVGR